MLFKKPTEDDLRPLVLNILGDDLTKLVDEELDDYRSNLETRAKNKAKEYTRREVSKTLEVFLRPGKQYTEKVHYFSDHYDSPRFETLLKAFKSMAKATVQDELERIEEEKVELQNLKREILDLVTSERTIDAIIEKINSKQLTPGTKLTNDDKASS